MKVKFWGTRGSITKAGPDTLKYGGNTSCVQVISSKGTMLVLDCGTGAHGLGMSIAKEGKAVSGHILITHTHWDHIQGVPFFTPLFIPGNSFHLYGPKGLGESMRETLKGQMQYTYFPISMEAFNANVEFRDLVEGSFLIDDVKVTVHYLNHPAITVGYRIEADGASVVYCTDHEPHDRALAMGGFPEAGSLDAAHVEFMRGADLLIHDCQYRAEEYSQKVGWGHSTLEYVVDMALAAHVRQVALFHHDPLRSDAGVDKMVADANARVADHRGAGQGEGEVSEFPVATQVFGAAEQGCVELVSHGEGGGGVRAEGSALDAPAEPALVQSPQFLGENVEVQHAVAVFVTDAASVKLLEAAFQGESYMTPHWATSAPEYFNLLATCAPSLVVLGKCAGGEVDIGFRLFAETQSRTPGVDVIVVCEDGQRAAGHGEVVQWLQAPFSPFYARTRMRSLLLKSHIKWTAAARSPTEDTRLATLRALNVLDTERESRYDLITSLASQVFNTNYSMVSLIDNDRQWFKSVVGTEDRETPRDVAFCAHVVLQDDVFVVNDATKDERFADSPLVTSGPRVRFYAGVPLKMANGQNVGAFCVVDSKPKALTQEQIDLLRQLGETVSAFLQAPADGAPLMLPTAVSAPAVGGTPVDKEAVVAESGAGQEAPTPQTTDNGAPEEGLKKGEDKADPVGTPYPVIASAGGAQSPDKNDKTRARAPAVQRAAPAATPPRKGVLRCMRGMFTACVGRPATSEPATGGTSV
eukprot:jgi/Mesvir1/18812/Mv04305-RA.1